HNWARQNAREITPLIQVARCAAALHDLDPPMIVVRRDCEPKCNGRCQHDSAKDSTEKNTSHIVPFDYFIIETRLQIGPALQGNLIGRGFAAVCERGNFEPVATLRTA